MSLAVAASSAFATGNKIDGAKYEGLLIQVLTANQRGVCPAELMRSQLKASCESQLPDLKTKFENLGTLAGVTYLGIKAMNGGAGEIYKVSFEHGDWTWTLSVQDGKECVAFAPAPVWNIGSYR